MALREQIERCLFRYVLTPEFDRIIKVCISNLIYQQLGLLVVRLVPQFRILFRNDQLVGHFEMGSQIGLKCAYFKKNVHTPAGRKADTENGQDCIRGPTVVSPVDNHLDAPSCDIEAR